MPIDLLHLIQEYSEMFANNDTELIKKLLEEILN